MSEFSTLKEEIVKWATSNIAMKKFTTHDVYDNIHSAETPSKASDALRRLHKEGVLEREEFFDGKMKKFIYFLKNYPKHIFKESTSFIDTHKELNDFKVVSSKKTMIEKLGEDFGRSEIVESTIQQIEIPDNFIIELKSPNGFVITIKAEDFIK